MTKNMLLYHFGPKYEHKLKYGPNMHLYDQQNPYFDVHNSQKCVYI
jgi:hypothetical protein